MTKIFLSYSSKDKDSVRKFVKDLESNDFEVWFDEDKIGIGDEIITKIQEGLQETNYLIIWLTKYSVESGWVRREWQSKLNEEIYLNKTLVLPILVEDCNIPSFLAAKKHADFREDYEAGFKNLIEDLKKKLN
ncbi:MAG: toll/interleukin-1 receptor domain-containing protein [Saprospiraceae bacterium]|nr:toll/interleukin-1 receptor domain-containing protein [Saprospiraceae bacterium]MCC6841880.1 toll/interleukin-1 receptor domain-containing protein [Saprospiraceae bacterium]